MKKFAMLAMLLLAPLTVMASGADSNPTQIMSLNESAAVTTSTNQNDTEYVYYWGNGCPFCAKVNAYFDKNKTEAKFNLTKKEVYYNADNAKELQAVWMALGLNSEDIGVPFLVYKDPATNKPTYLSGAPSIIELFTNLGKADAAVEQEIVKAISTEEDKTSSEKTAAEVKAEEIKNETKEDKKEMPSEEEKSKMPLIALIIVLIIAAAGWAYYFYNKKA